MIRKRTKPRRGRVIDKAYLAWIAAQGCCISGRPATVHHVRQFGSPRDDTRTIPLAPEFHLIQCGRYSIEALGKKNFEAHHDVDIEALVLHYRSMFLAQNPEA